MKIRLYDFSVIDMLIGTGKIMIAVICALLVAGMILLAAIVIKAAIETIKDPETWKKGKHEKDDKKDD